MADKVQCGEHGDQTATFVCVHLAQQDALARGFHRSHPTEDDPFPSAWCDECEAIREAHDGWDEESEKLTSIKLLCAGCYEQTRLRNEYRRV